MRFHISSNQLNKDFDLNELWELLDYYIISDEDVIEFINECYEEIELPVIGKVPAGKVLYAIFEKGNSDNWNEIRDSFIEGEYVNLIDIFYHEQETKVNYRGYTITKLD